MALATSAQNDLPTRQRYDELLKKYRVQLLRSVYPTEVLLSALSQIKAFEEKVSDIRLVRTTKEKADKILSLPSDKDYEENISGFLSVLRENGHAHVGDVFITGSGEGLLTEDNYQRIRQKLKDLCDYLDPDCGILQSLTSEGVFTQSEKELVQWEGTAKQKVETVMEILLCKSNRSYERFISILQENDQEHIVYILTEEREGSPPLSREELKLIRIQRASVVENMDSLNTKLITRLMSLEVFTEDERQRVEYWGERRMKRNEEILNILARKSRRHFDNFIKALNETNQEHVAELFEAITINATVDVNHGSSSEQSAEVEEDLKSTFTKDLQNEESEISRDLDSIGIHGVGVGSGSIKIWFKFLTGETLDDMQNGILDRIFSKRYRELCNRNGVTFRIVIDENEFKRCMELLRKRQQLLTPQHREALQLAAEQIPDKIRVDKDLLDDLALCSYRQDAILNQKSGVDKVTVLLEVMACRPDCEFQQFVDALKRTVQNAAANFIGKNIR